MVEFVPYLAESVDFSLAVTSGYRRCLARRSRQRLEHACLSLLYIIPDSRLRVLTGRIRSQDGMFIAV